MRIRSVAAVWTVVLFAAAVAWAGNQAQVGKPAPEFEAVSIPEGRPISLGSLKGRPAALVFWISQCGRCKGEIPHLADLRARYAEDELAMLALTEESTEQIRDFVASSGINYAVATDLGYKAHGQYGVKEYPAAFVLDLDGTVTFEGSPAEPGFDAALEAVMAQSMSKRPFGKAWAALAERGEGQDSVLLEIVCTAGPKAPRRSLTLDVMGAHFETQPPGGTARRADFALTDDERAALLAALRAAEFDRLPGGFGALKPGAPVVELTVILGAEAAKTVRLAETPAGYVRKNVRIPEPLLALWQRLDPLVQRGEAKAR